MCGLSVIALDESHERDCLVGTGSSDNPARKKELVLLSADPHLLRRG